MTDPGAGDAVRRTRLANERTYLAWLRTGIAISSLGFVVARFDIFLRELTNVSAPAAANEVAKGTQTSIPIGVFLVLAGPAIIVLALIGYLHTDRALLEGRTDTRPLIGLVMAAVTGMSVVTGVGLALHLLNTWPR